MTTTITRTLRYGKGYTGKMGHRCWVAEIIGTDGHNGLQRYFLDPDSVEREHFNRARTMVRFSFALALEGLYELSEGGERWFVAVLPNGDQPRIRRISDKRAKAWAEALDACKTPREARLVSKGL